MIKPVVEIPESRMSAAKSYRQRITDDIQEAIDKGIPLFEFVGDYNYKYLAQYAREQANRLNRQYVNNVVRKNRERWADRIICSRECNWFRGCVYGKEFIRRRGW